MCGIVGILTNSAIDNHFDIEIKKMADAKATALETEIAALREEAKSLKILMGQGQPSVNQLKVS